MIILIQNVLFLKDFLPYNGCFWLFSKMKKGSGTSFRCTFPAWFFHKNIPYLILYQWAKFQCHTLFLSRDIKQNVLSFYLDSSWCHKLWDSSWVNLKKWLTREKIGEDKNTKDWISREQKEIFRWNKKHFSRFLKDYHLVKKEIW